MVLLSILYVELMGVRLLVIVRCSHLVIVRCSHLVHLILPYVNILQLPTNTGTLNTDLIGYFVESKTFFFMTMRDVQTAI